MTLQEAVKSGKRFRHKNGAPSVWLFPGVSEFDKCTCTLEEALSDDWMIQQKETFTRAEVELIARKVAGSFFASPDDRKQAVAWAMKAAESSDEDMTSKSGDEK